MAAAVAGITGCSKDDDPGMHPVMVNISYKYSEDGNSQHASPCLVQLYKVALADFDAKASETSMYENQDITLKDGSTPRPAFISSSFVGVNTFLDVPDGDYLVIAYFKPEGFTWPMFFYYGYKQIRVDSHSTNFYDLCFVWSRDAGKFVEL